jgi:signal peptidase I
MFPVDANAPCAEDQFPGRRVTAADGKLYCRLPIVRETLPGGARFDTIDLEYNPAVDEFPEITIPAGRVFVMGDNRDRSADSRVPAEGMGLGGPVPFENLGGRAEFITFSLDGSSEIYNPISWFTALRGGRALTSLHPERTQP